MPWLSRHKGGRHFLVRGGKAHLPPKKFKLSAKKFSEDFFMLTRSMTPAAVERINKFFPRLGTKQEKFKRWLERKQIPFKEKDERFVVGDVDFWFVDGKYDGWGVKVRKPFAALVRKFWEEEE